MTAQLSRDDGASVAPLVVAVALAGALVGCGGGESRVRRVILWEGSEDCQACPVQAVTLWPSPPARISLRKNTVCTVQLEMQTSGDSDRCVYKFVSDTWAPPLLPSFDCQPEREVMRRSFQTRQSASFPRDQDILFLRVDVYSTSNPFDAPKGVTLLSQQYDVDWVP